MHVHARGVCVHAAVGVVGFLSRAFLHSEEEEEEGDV